jgi:hypothetical protein
VRVLSFADNPHPGWSLLQQRRALAAFKEVRMSGKVIHAIPRTPYDFSLIPPNVQCPFLAVRDIDVSGYRELTLLVRVHAVSMTYSNSTIYVGTQMESISPDDPASDFLGTSLGTYVGVTQSTPVPTLLMATIPTPFGGLMNITVEAVTGGNGGATLKATLSVDLIAKS